MKIEDAIRVRYEKGGMNFEILVKEKEYELYREGKIDDLNQVLFTQEIFKSVSTAERPSEEELEKAFNTSEFEKIVKEILKEGDYQLTTEQRNRMKEEKKRQIIALISRLAKDPRTNAPHPPSRIENAMEEAKINIDPLKSVDQQMKEVVDKLSRILPLSFEKKAIAIKIPIVYSGKAYSIVKEISDIKEEEWHNDFLFLKVEIPAGVQSELIGKLGNLTHGEVEIVELK